MIAHTEEPWEIDEPTQIWAPSIAEYVAITNVEPELNLVPQEVQEANARRIVACVNACEGFDTVHLEAVPNKGLFKLAAFSRDVVAQCDQLRELCGELFIALRHLNHNAIKSGAEMGLALNVAKDAIAKAEKVLGGSDGTTN